MLSSAARFLLLVFSACVYCFAGDSLVCNFPVSATFTEDAVTISWPEYPGAASFNVYADYGIGFKKANFTRVATRKRFTLLWVEDNREKKRIVKGNRVECRVVPLIPHVNKNDTTYVEGPPSCPVKNGYFTGFSKVLSDTACARILTSGQRTAKIFPSAVSVSRAAFCSKYAGLARDIYASYTAKIDPHDEGACVPFSSLVAKYFTQKGIPCYRGQGVFVSAFHSFDIIVIDSVEYVLDFTADQFVPGSSPVFMPRDWCFADSTGMPTAHPAGTFTKFYQIEKVFSANQIAFTETPKAKEYQQLLDSLQKK
ncbi:MAG TPA: hypothetical protein VLX68_16790 [Chitinivibrionales bacterium]|nr:hypothetical protein [Chitinivibrionales bacterium]